MAGKFERKRFSEIDISDPFFNTLKQDYPEFERTWFPKGVQENREALVFSDEIGLGAFIALKRETEAIVLQEGVIPARPRIKISTFRLAERFRGKRLGEGALGLILWDWQNSKLDEIYLTVFQKHTDLTTQLERFGFCVIGHNSRNELVYMRSRKTIDYSDPYKAFPFISPNFSKGGYLIVEDFYHDALFPYSELKNVPPERLIEADAANGISKIYVGKQWRPHYRIGEPIFIYRKYNGSLGKPRYKSCLTSFCIVAGVILIKENGRYYKSFDEFCSIVGNKAVFQLDNLEQRYNSDKNVTVIKMLYGGYFGAGHNINMDWLDQNRLWSSPNQYPTQIRLSPQECLTIWSAGQIDTADIFGR
ncbi:MAG TPA: hypothetical protein DCZ00_00080 [Lactococcus sp.]|nr:hypothetical protein [Lactococcus sp.]